MNAINDLSDRLLHGEDIFESGVEDETGETKQYLDDISLFGDPIPPEPSNRGLIDTAIVEAREMIRITATFDKPGTYVWHCHMLIHEDHDMMRPFVVIPASEAATENSDEAFVGGGGALIAENDGSDELLQGGNNALTTEVLSNGANEVELLSDFTVISEQQLVSSNDSNSLLENDPLSTNPLLENGDSDSELSPLLTDI